jgi:hypothetical protein
MSTPNEPINVEHADNVNVAPTEQDGDNDEAGKADGTTDSSE